LTLFSLDCPPAVYTVAPLQAVAHVVAKAEPAANMKIEANTSWQQVMTDIRDFMVGHSLIRFIHSHQPIGT
jgi:hypothetical protein